MNLVFKQPNFQYMLDSILTFQEDTQSEFFRDSLFHFYPQFDKKKMLTLDREHKTLYLSSELEKIYFQNIDIFKEKIQAYQLHWDTHKAVIQQTFEEIFDLSLKDELNELVGYININPICPRYLDTNSFDIFYLNSDKGALGMSLHEMTHFVWFQKWQAHFKDNSFEYDAPYLKWIFSEMVVESILSDKRLYPLNPYAGHCVYSYFYDIHVDGVPLLNLLDDLYKQNSITDFMEKGLILCQEHETLIRTTMG